MFRDICKLFVADDLMTVSDIQTIASQHSIKLVSYERALRGKTSDFEEARAINSVVLKQVKADYELKRGQKLPLAEAYADFLIALNAKVVEVIAKWQF